MLHSDCSDVSWILSLDMLEPGWRLNMAWGLWKVMESWEKMQDVICISTLLNKTRIRSSGKTKIDCMTKEYGQNLQEELGCSTIFLRQRNFWVKGPTFQICCFKLSLQPWIWTIEVTHYQLEWRLNHASNMIREENPVYKLYSNENNSCRLLLCHQGLEQ